MSNNLTYNQKIARQTTKTDNNYNLQNLISTVNKVNPLPYIKNAKNSYGSQKKNRKKLLEKDSIQKFNKSDSNIKKYEDLYNFVDSYKKKQFKKRLIMSPNKIVSQQKILEAFEPNQKQMQQLKIKRNFSSNSGQQSAFSMALRQLGIIYGGNDYKNQKKMVPCNLITSLNCYVRKSDRDKLKPISQTFIKVNPIDFLNIQKIILNQGQSKNKPNLLEVNAKKVQTFVSERHVEIRKNLDRIAQIKKQRRRLFISDQILSKDKEKSLINESPAKLPHFELPQQPHSFSRSILKVNPVSQMSQKKIQKLQQNGGSKISFMDIKFGVSTCLNLPLVFKKSDQQIQFHDQQNDGFYKDKELTQTLQLVSKQQSQKTIDNILEKQTKILGSSPIKFRKKRKYFQIPFETFYYRNLIWKVNFTNDVYVQTPIQYQHRLKAYIGKGNNSSMIVGLIKRRIWFAITDKLEQANFVWTQLKMLTYYKKQKSISTSNYQKSQKNDLKTDKKLQITQSLNDKTQRISDNNKQQKSDKKIQQKSDNSKQQKIDSNKQQKIDNNKQQKQAKYMQSGILNSKDHKAYQRYFDNFTNFQQKSDQRLLNRSKNFKFWTSIKVGQIKQLKVQNHLINNYLIGNKKALFHTMSNFYNSTNQQVFSYLPLTFHLCNGLQDETYFRFLKHYHKRNKQIKSIGQKGSLNTWIVKPGENSNRGNGIQVCLTLDQIKAIVRKKQKYHDGTNKTFIVQSYIEKPLLYQKRKFDIRHYMMITSVNNYIKGYWYKQGYVRTTSTEYNLKTNCGKIHLTNDAVQKNLQDYGKYQKGNKISYQQLQNCMSKTQKHKDFDFYGKIYPKMKKIATDVMKACSGGIDPQKLKNNFQIFGLDFMIDANHNVWLIQVNTNPCLQLSCPLLGSIIPKMVQNTLQLTLDCLFPPPVRYSPKGLLYYKNLQQQNRYQLVYDQRIDGLNYSSVNVLDAKMLNEEDDTFEDDGDEWKED